MDYTVEQMPMMQRAMSGEREHSQHGGAGASMLATARVMASRRSRGMEEWQGADDLPLLTRRDSTVLSLSFSCACVTALGSSPTPIHCIV